MSRSGYTDDGENVAMWRGQVASAIRGKRGQAFFIEMVEALDALPEKKLIAYDLHQPSGAVCAIGSVGLRRGVDMAPLDPEDSQQIAKAFGIAHQLVAEIEYMNDEAVWYKETPEARWARMRAWALSHVRDDATRARLALPTPGGP